MGITVHDQMPAHEAIHVGTRLRSRAIRGQLKRAFNPEEMTRHELVRFCGALIEENGKVRDFAKAKEDEVQAHLQRMEGNIAAWRQSAEKWRTEYAFHLTLVRETLDKLKAQGDPAVLEPLADAIATTCTAHTPPAGTKAGGALTAWLHKAKLIWELLDKETLFPKERTDCRTADRSIARKSRS